jgi:hypothetical protein
MSPQEFQEFTAERAAVQLKFAKAAMFDELVAALLCHKTLHLCGTDTIPVGQPCQCESCALFTRAEALQSTGGQG